MGKVHFASSTVHSPWTALRVRWVPVYCFPTLSLRAFAMCAAFPHSDYYALFDCLLGLGVSSGFPHSYSPPSFIPCRLSRVHDRGLKQNAVGGVLPNAPSTLCGFPTVTQGSAGLPVSLRACRTCTCSRSYFQSDPAWFQLSWLT